MTAAAGTSPDSRSQPSTTPTPAPQHVDATAPKLPLTAEIRPLRDGDVDAVVTLSLRAWESVFASIRETVGSPLFAYFYGDDWRAHQATDVRRACTTYDAFVAHAGGQVVGFTAVDLPSDSAEGEIYMVAVDPDAQGTGVGLQLTMAAVDHIRRAGTRAAVVGTGGDPGHAAARTIYRKAGFTAWPSEQLYLLLDAAREEQDEGFEPAEFVTRGDVPCVDGRPWPDPGRGARADPRQRRRRARRHARRRAAAPAAGAARAPARPGRVGRRRRSTRCGRRGRRGTRRRRCRTTCSGSAAACPTGVIESAGDGYRLDPARDRRRRRPAGRRAQRGRRRRSRRARRRSTPSSTAGTARPTPSSTTSTTAGPRPAASTSCGSGPSRRGAERRLAGRRHRRAGRRAGARWPTRSRCASDRGRC